MAIKIRLQRKGRKGLAFYDIVIANDKSPRDGNFIEKIGNYNPNTIPSTIILNEELALKWLLNGAKVTNTVKYIFHNFDIFLKKHLKIGFNKGLITKIDLDKKLNNLNLIEN